MLQVGGPFSFHLDRRLQQKRDRYVSLMDRAKLLDLSQCVVQGPRLGQHLGPFFDASSSWEKTAACGLVTASITDIANPILPVLSSRCKIDIEQFRNCEAFAI